MEYVVEIKGLDTLQKQFEQAPQTTTREVTMAINKSLVRYQATAKTLSPIDTGRLRGSISLSPAKRTENVIEGSVGTDVHYALYQEVGTRRGVPARLYMKGSLDENQKHTDNAFEQAAENIANELAGRQAA